MEASVSVETATTSSQEPDPILNWSRVHRIMAGDKVTLNQSEHEVGLVPNVDVGTVVGFGNEEKTYLEVDFGEKGVHTLTEDELHRTG